MRRRRQESKSPQTFMEYAQAHERAWGFESYDNRPPLELILSSPVVIFWQHAEQERFTISVHSDLSAVEKLITKAVIRGTIYTTKRRIIKIYQHQKQIAIKEVSLKFEKIE